MFLILDHGKFIDALSDMQIRYVQNFHRYPPFLEHNVRELHGSRMRYSLADLNGKCNQHLNIL